jgi:hypothetical protein
MKRIKRKKVSWLRPALVPFFVKRLAGKADHRRYVSRYGAPIWIDDRADKDAQRIAYRALLGAQWLAPKVRAAIVRELGMDVRQEQR